MKWSTVVFYINSFVLALAALIGAIYALITHSTKLKAWLKQRKDRRMKLDELIDGANNILCSHAVIEEQNKQIEKLTETTETITEDIKDLSKTIKQEINHKTKLDEAIDKSTRQGKVHNLALFALLDAALKEGKDGPITEAHTLMRGYLIDEACGVDIIEGEKNE